jgi:glutamate/tyrosine decarboxylase-like PLP-dependent enzyme
MESLQAALKQGNVGTVVVTLGTTSTGSADPLRQVLDLQALHKFRIHVDSAYGGYYALAGNLTAEVARSYSLMSKADSIVVDPHKHGLQPYGCGCVLFRDPTVGAFYKHDSPYTYFSSEELHLGEISLECSRAGSSAAALWATQQMFPLVKCGEFAQMLERCRSAALALQEKLQRSGRFILPIEPDLDIVIYLPKAQTASAISELSRKIFTLAAKKNLHLALATLPKHLLQNTTAIEWDDDKVTVLRSCLLKPEHLDWVDQIAELLNLAYDETLVSV